MKLSLNVLEHLGLNLYSHVPAVLAEAVANAWDADATRVDIDIDADSKRIEIVDNGLGMSRTEVLDRFLVEGFRRRDARPGLTERERQPMGRKGIGKLSLFSLAHNVEVQTVKEGNVTAWRMKLADIRRSIQENDGTYKPEEFEPEKADRPHGTRFILTDLQRRLVKPTIPALRKRLARRFVVIGSRYDFRVFVNGEEITPADRDYYAKLQFLWTYGDQSGMQALGVEPVQTDPRPSCFGAADTPVSGWIGTVKRSGDLKDTAGSDNLNRIAIYVRGKLAQEDILGQFSERRVYAGYLIGELQIDAFDMDDKPDAATSNRQQIVEDDERFRELKAFLQKELNHIGNRWTEWRNEAGVKKALEIPAVSQWMERLPSEHRPKAKAWIGRLNRMPVDVPADRGHLVKHAILAFEFYRAHDNLARLEHVGDQSLDDVLELFQELDSLELALYGQIVQQRLSIIKTLQDMVERNEYEKVIQGYLFDHLWLLDPHWERIESTEFMETTVAKMFERVDAELTEDEKKGRIDIGYRSTAGKHVIVELKRPEVAIDLSDLEKQIRKYRSGLAKILQDLGEPLAIEIVVLLGKRPGGWEDPGGPQIVTGNLANLGARFVLYDELLQQAHKAYLDYSRKRRDVVDRLQTIIKDIEDYSPS